MPEKIPVHYTMKSNPKIVFRRGRYGWESSDDGGINWHYTQRTDAEISEWCDCPIQSDEPDLEIWGDTLDEPLPDDFLEMLQDCHSWDSSA